MESKGRRTAPLAAPMHGQALVPASEEKPGAPTDKLPTPALAPPEPVLRRISGPAPEPTGPQSAAAGGGGAARNPITESGAAIARGLDALNEAIAAYARHRIETAARAAIDLLAVRTWSEAVALNTNFARTSFDQWLANSAKMSDLGVKLALEYSRPLLIKEVSRLPVEP